MSDSHALLIAEITTLRTRLSEAEAALSEAKTSERRANAISLEVIRERDEARSALNGMTACAKAYARQRDEAVRLKDLAQDDAEQLAEQVNPAVRGREESERAVVELRERVRSAHTNCCPMPRGECAILEAALLPTQGKQEKI